MKFAQKSSSEIGATGAGAAAPVSIPPSNDGYEGAMPCSFKVNENPAPDDVEPWLHGHLAPVESPFPFGCGLPLSRSLIDHELATSVNAGICGAGAPLGRRGQL